MRAASFLVFVLLTSVPWRASAGTVLFVSDASTDANIADALRADGHTVTVVLSDFTGSSNPTLEGDLAPYDCVVWSASGYGFGGIHSAATFTNLTAYAESGGRVLVTGIGSVGYSDLGLVRFLGGTTGTSYAGPPQTVASVESSLTVGPVDLRGVTPLAYEFSYEGIGGVGTDTVVIVAGTDFRPFGDLYAQWTVRTLGAGEIAFIANGSGDFSHPSWTTATEGPSGAYNGALRNFVAAAGALVSEPGAPAVVIRGAFASPEGSEAMLTAEIVDPEGDTFSYSWDLDGDGTFGEMADTATVSIPTGDGPSGVLVAVEAIDSAGHTTRRQRNVHFNNVAPAIISTPPVRASIAENLVYTIEVDEPAGAADPLTFELVRGPSTASVVGNAFRFIPTEGDITAVGTAIDCEVAVTDDDGGRTTQVWRMEVANNYAPSGLLLEFPKNDVALIDRTPRLAVRDGIDVDGDALTYYFQLDTVDTFDSEDLLESGAVPEEPGFTTFEITEPLADGHYYWRAWLSDGDAETVPEVTSFWVLTPMGEAPDAGTEDGGTIGTDAGGGGGSRSDCACHASRGTWSPTVALSSLVVVGILLVRRRRPA